MKINDIIIDENMSIVQAMKVLDNTSKKILFVADNGILKAAMTDGDIRRWILSNGNLDAKVKNVANYSPKYIFEENREEVKRIFLDKGIDAIPVVDSNKKIISVIFRDDKIINNNMELSIPVVIMAGGLGTRLYPYTKILPKPLIPIGEIPIAEHIINKFKAFKCNDFYLIVNHKKNMIKAYFNEIEKDYDITYIDEDKPLGTGGGLSLLKGKINSTFILSNCDILIDDDYYKIYEHHKREDNIITMVCSLKNITIPYGVVEVNESGNIHNMREKPDLSFLTNTGMYIVEERVIEELEQDAPISFPEIIEKYRNNGEKVGIYPISENSWLDMGQLDEMENMRKKLEIGK